MPLFSTKAILNQLVIEMLSPNIMLDFTSILTHWSIASMATTINHVATKLNCLLFILFTFIAYYLFFRNCLDATLSVACGTARSRSLGISSPVIRSIP